MQRLLAVVMGGALLLSACAQAEPATVAARSGLGVAGEAGEVASKDTGRARSPKAKRAKKAEKAGSAGGQALAGPATCPSIGGGGDFVAQLVDVRVGTHPGYDRVVFEFAPPERGARYFGIPRYEIRRIDGAISEDPSGRPLTVAGNDHVGIVFHGASGVDFTTSSPQGYVVTYTGPGELKPGYEVLTEAERTGDFEATLSWAFGLDRSSCWRVLHLTDPTRVVIDFPHA